MGLTSSIRNPLFFFSCNLLLNTLSLSNAFSVAVTGDVNFHPNLTNYPPEYPWGELRETLLGFDLLLINHESTSSNLDDPYPNDYKYEDPINKTAALLQAGGVSFTGQSNNHQFDFWDIGVNRTMSVLSSLDISNNIKQGGLYSKTENIENDVKSPIIFNISKNTSSSLSTTVSPQIAIFSLVAQLCHKDPNTGEDIMDSCTCGIPDNTSSTFSDMPPAQCYLANETEPGLWYLSYPLSSYDINNTCNIIKNYKLMNPNHIIIINIHAGPNFEWEPENDRESLLRNLSDAGADLVWGTSSHHIQRMENRITPITPSPYSTTSTLDERKQNKKKKEKQRKDDGSKKITTGEFGRPIIFGLGDLLFRFIPGVDKPETCEQGMAPCQRFRPAISVIYEFIYDFKTQTQNNPNNNNNNNDNDDDETMVLTAIRAHGTIHDSLQIYSVQGEDKRWLKRKFNELSSEHGFMMQEDDDTGDLWVVPI